MNELWKVLLNSGMSLEEMEHCRYIPAEAGSPYLETQPLPNHVFSINPYLRFAEMFQMMMEQEEFKNSEEGQLLFHTFMELIFQVERYGGYDKEAFQKEMLREEIQKGYFGECVRDGFMNLSDIQQSRTVENLIVMYKTGTGENSYLQEMQNIFPKCMVFRHKEEKKQFYIYMGEEKTRRNEEIIALIQKLFLPMDCRCNITWEYPYVLLDSEQIQLVGDQYALN